MSLSRLTLYTFFFLLIASSCSNKSDVKSISHQAKNQSWINLNDSILLRNIREYISTYELNDQKDIIVVSMTDVGAKSIIFIESTIRQPSENLHPSLFTIVDSFLVLIYSNIDKYVDKSNAVAEVSEYIQNHNIQVEKELNRIYHFPIWEYTVCGDEYKLYKEITSISTINLPCGLVFEKDTSQIGYKVVKEK